MAYMTMKVGRLYFNPIKDYLDECKFKGLEIDYIEGRGWLTREYTVKGSDKDIENIKADIQAWIKKQESNDG